MPKAVSDLKVEYLPVSSLLPYVRNARTHDDAQVAQIAGSIKEFGFNNPILVAEDKSIIAGHGRALAAHKLGLDLVPTIRLGHLTDSQRRAYLLADNRLALNAEWDTAMLTLELQDLKDDVDLNLLGFGGEELQALLNPEVETEFLTDPDSVPEDVETRCKPGDLWVLGSHRLLCGDSTNVQHLERLMGGEKAEVWLSDPPYGISHVKTSQEKGHSKGYTAIANDDLKDDDLKDFIFSVISASLPHMREGFAFYMWHAMKMQGYTAAAAAAAGILFHRQIVWVKPQFVFGRGHYHWRHELCLMGWLQGNEPPFYGERNQTTVWECGRENDKIHPTQKPIRILEPGILNHTHPGGLVYDPFMGSGSTLIACEKTGRRCFGMEIDPKYCSVILARWEKFTGKTAALEVPHG